MPRSPTASRPIAGTTPWPPSRRWARRSLNEQTQAVEVTTAVVDLDARIENLRVTERSLQAIMAQATKIPDILEVQSQLTTVRGEIEQLTAERDHLHDQASYGTLTVGWSMPVVAVTTVQGAWDPAAIVDEALAQLVQLGQSVLTAGIWLAIVGLPLLLVGLVIFGLVLLVARRLGRRPSPRAGGRRWRRQQLAIRLAGRARDARHENARPWGPGVLLLGCSGRRRASSAALLRVRDGQGGRLTGWLLGLATGAGATLVRSGCSIIAAAATAATMAAPTAM